MEAVATLSLALLLELLLIVGRASSQCSSGCICVGPFPDYVTMDCTPRPDLTGVDAIYTYVPGDGAATLTRM